MLGLSDEAFRAINAICQWRSFKRERRLREAPLRVRIRARFFYLTFVRTLVREWGLWGFVVWWFGSRRLYQGIYDGHVPNLERS